MVKNFLFAMALLSLAFAVGCAKGGNGLGSGVTVAVSDGNASVVGATLTQTFTATVTGASNTAVTWTLSGTGCSSNSSLCGSFATKNSTSATFQAPATAPNPATVTITATSVEDPAVSGSLTISVIPVTTVVTPTTVLVGENLAQPFTAVAVPDAAPQTFTWTCTPTASCGGVVQDQTTSGLAVYTAPSSTQSGVQVTATSTVPQVPASNGAGAGKVTVVASRLPSGNYAFQFSGYDATNNPVAAAGTITVGANGAVTKGFEDVVTPAGRQQVTISSGSYTPNSNNNNLGTLTLNLSGGGTNTYTAVLTSTFPNGSGTMRMIESDSSGVTGSGVLQKSGTFAIGVQTFAFGFTGTDSNGKRAGYAGTLPMDGSGNIGSGTAGQADGNDNGTSVCGASPCTVLGTYSADVAVTGLWHMTLALSSGATLDFDFFVGGGQTQTKTGPNPLTLYAVSTDAVDSTHPLLSGPMVYQVPMTYNNAAFAGSSVSNLTGANANVSLTLGTTDGTSSGTGGTGKFTGNFDWNNNGTIVSVGTSSPFSYTYAGSGTSGRYTFQMLGNPAANPVVAPLPFILYASGANRGFLLDQSSAAVMTGTMDPQPTQSTFYTNTEMPGTYAAATIPDSNTNVVQPVVQNLLLTSPGNGVFNLTGTQNPNSQSLTGTYSISDGGYGSITLTSPPAPAVATNVIYAIDFDATNFVVTDFMMMGTTSGSPSSIVFAQQ